ncbi:succinate dehydrogenase [ubiquinone] cytochrome b small subunit, mitochondrial [Microplitis mediator]|uniref:succinate dehydrogenase [ubiquinone] cytochrome b small subunit, mitochondrial n=1 Tax=Microplitis mediator TaxID=375433 RepID=UPI0025554F18|nr:succinate dehydrogenase [ubiquinone] cytochrome b small subunit, mitochondrial [Microplitis mediator]
MAYLSRCQIGRTLPTLAKLIGSGKPAIAQKNVVPAAIRAYSSTSFTKNVSRLSLQSINQLKRFPGAINAFASQIRSSSTGDHVRLWQLERIASAAFIVLFPACFLLQNAVVDLLFSTLLVVHTHWGLEALIVDYARPAIVGPILPKALMGLLYVISVATLAGLGALIYNGPGVSGSVKKIWEMGQK